MDNQNVQKFKRGNKVKILFGHPMWSSGKGCTDCAPELVGRLAVIEGSYADLYWGQNRTDYALMFLDNGNRQSWFSETQLEFVDDGGEYLLDECKKIHDDIVSRQSNLKWIKNNWNDTSGISSVTILKLFEEIGFDSSFKRNGEYYILFSDWKTMKPIYDSLFAENLDKALEITHNIFKPEYQNQYESNVKQFYDKLKTA